MAVSKANKRSTWNLAKDSAEMFHVERALLRRSMVILTNGFRDCAPTGSASFGDDEETARIATDSAAQRRHVG